MIPALLPSPAEFPWSFVCKAGLDGHVYGLIYNWSAAYIVNRFETCLVFLWGDNLDIIPNKIQALSQEITCRNLKLASGTRFGRLSGYPSSLTGNFSRIRFKLPPVFALAYKVSYIFNYSPIFSQILRQKKCSYHFQYFPHFVLWNSLV